MKTVNKIIDGLKKLGFNFWKCFYRLPYISLSFLFDSFLLTASPWNIEKFFNNMNFSAFLASPKFIQKSGTTWPVSLVTKVVCQIQKSGTRIKFRRIQQIFGIEKWPWKIRKMQFLVTSSNQVTLITNFVKTLSYE